MNVINWIIFIGAALIMFVLGIVDAKESGVSLPHVMIAIMILQLPAITNKD